MKNKNWVKLALAAFLVSGMSVSSAMAADTNGKAEALVVIPITISHNNDVQGFDSLNFGGIIPDIAGGTVTVDLAGNATSPTLTLIAPAASADLFTVGGEPNRTYAITGDTSATLTGGGADMIANLNIAAQNAGGTNVAGTLDGVGADTILVGGTLNVGPSQAPDAYTANYNIIVNYN